MNFVVKWLIERKVQVMLNKLWVALDGHKTYLLAVVGVLIAVAGHFFGPFTVGSLQVPQFSWGEVWAIVWNGGLFSALRHGAEKA